MKTFTKISARKEKGRILKFCFLLFLFIIPFTINAVADEGPSLKNVKKNGQAIKTEQAREAQEEQERLAFQEKMSYVYMAVGLALVLGIAWFSTVYTRKNKKVVVETTNHHRHYIKHPHDPRRRPKTRSGVRR